ncbi:TPA: type VI secretion system baseplate subunit TssK [Escherichia coli]|nr:type VI secretion system baseplate subunit TssK [Escherichia coli]
MATTRNKVMWQEGMLMRPHHFQQQQRYNDYLDNQRFRAMNNLSWGFTELTLNNELLAQGKIMIDSASGTLPDGTVFSIPDQDALPDPLHPQHFPDERSRNIYLALPVASDVRNEISDGRRIGRYRLNYADVRDLHSEEGDTRTLTLGQLTPRIMSGAEDMSAYITLPLCRISDRHADGSLTLDDDFIPSCQNIQVSKKLRVYLKEVQGAIGGRASDLANRIGSPAQSGIADVAEFMMLQLLNRNQTRFTHRARRSQLHPEDFYLDLAGLLGELKVVTDVQAVEQLLQEQGYEPGVIISFRYILCTFIDEAALGNGWSNKNEWIKQSLLVHFHNEAWGGEKVFILLERLIREPKRYQDLLEFLWLCFSLGFRGRYKVAAQDQGEFEQIYRRLYHVLHKLRGDAPFPLLHQDKKTQGGRYQLISRLTIKHIFCGGVVVLALFYLFYLLRLDSQTQDILHQLNKLLR